MANPVLTSQEVLDVLRLAEDIAPTCRGGNSTITRIAWHGYDLAVKHYSARRDANDRMRREVKGLWFLEQARLREFPQCLGISTDKQRAILTWVPGVVPQADDQSVRAMTAVLEHLHRASHLQLAHSIEPAADAIVSLDDVVEQVRQRSLALSSSRAKAVAEFASQLLFTLSGLGPSRELGSMCSTLSLSDFGRHNMLVEEVTRRFVFLDLEFFGWDDAHKLIIDTLLHPLATWTQQQSEDFVDSASAIFLLDRARLANLAPFMALKWAAIVAARSEREWLASEYDACEQSLMRARSYLRRAVGCEPSEWMSVVQDW